MKAAGDGLTLRRISAAELLAIRRSVMEMELADELERCMVGNAMVLAACCMEDGQAAFESGQAAMSRLTAQEMERLLRRIAEADGAAARPAAESWEDGGSAGFDEARFLRLKEGGRE